MTSYRCTTRFPVRAGKVQFGLLSSEETRKLSTVQIKDTTIYYRGLPNPYGINDHRMGTVDRRLLCGTCCRDVKECQGHVGHIELAFPMLHIGFFDTCFKTLRCVCFACSRVMLTASEIHALQQSRVEGKLRFQAAYGFIKGRKRCHECSMTQPQYTRTPLGIRCDWAADTPWMSEEERAYCTQPFTQRDVLSILNHITTADAELLGFNEFCHPRSFVLTTILVPPPVARPAIMASEGSRSRGQDDLTHKLQDISKRSNELVAAMGEESTWRDVAITAELVERINRLQFEVFTYMNNNIRGQKQSTQRSGAPTKSLTDRLRGKDGRIRGNLMGKRVDFSARSVITPDAVMDVDQVGIPHHVAMCLTVPERVTNDNIESLTRRIVNGPTHIFGAENVITANGITINLENCENRDKIRLQYGWVVERFLTDNDVVIFNRQPSLHKVGMMGHRVKLMPGNTFRLNLCCANPYNADFDGDEMNLHVPQSPAAIADVVTLMMVPTQIISPQANRPVMGIVQDSLLGAHLLSCNDVLLDRQTACHVIAHAMYAKRELPPPAIVRPKELWTGKQMLSLILPETLYLGSMPSSTDLTSHGKRVIVRRGMIVCGELRKNTLGTSAGGFVDVLYRQFGSVVTVRWMSDIQRLVNSWLMLRGFSVGVSDCVLSHKGEERVRERIETAMRYADELVREFATEDTAEASLLEGTVVKILSKCLMQTGGIVDEELDESNAIRKMVNAGSKGTPINLSQICGCVGQQSVEGRRVFAEKGGRTLSFFEHQDSTLAGHGFVENSYALGLNAYEYFYHAMGGREGLVDTAVKTATTGYIQRRQMKSMEDHKICYDGTVRNAEDAIVDFSYGGDGMDATMVERVALPMLEQSEATLCERLLPWEGALAVRLRRTLIRCKRPPIDNRILLPFSPTRLRWTITASAPREAAADGVASTLRAWLHTQKSVAIQAAVIDFFNTGELLRLGMDNAAVERLLAEIDRAVDAARINYGEMVGSIAAQSIGEPCTQMTLNTFHFAGVSSKNVTLGIPRLKELLDQSKTIKTPSNCIRFRGPLAQDAAFASYFACTLPLTRLSDIVRTCEFVFDPDPHATIVDADAAMVDLNERVGEALDENASRFVIRLILDQNIMKLRRVTPPVVRTLLRNRLGNKAQIISSETNEVDWVVRIRFREIRRMMDGVPNSREREGQLCHRVVSVMLDTIAISGHINVTAAHVNSVDTDDGGTEYVVDTQGCNMIDMSAAPCVDWYRTTSNDINEVHATLGLEAAVNVLYTELTTTISFDGTYVDPRHIMMIVNTMCRGGYIMPLSRHGINRMDTGPLLRCSFEETPDILCDAACFGELDNGKGVSQNIMTGKLPKIGSGSMHIKMAPALMHPRDVLQTSQPLKRVLKSSVRRREQPNEQCVEMSGVVATSSVGNNSRVIEPPFESESETMHANAPMDNSIFGTDMCHAPYNDNHDTVAHTSYAPAVESKTVYRPSSPALDDDDV